MAAGSIDSSARKNKVEKREVGEEESSSLLDLRVCLFSELAPHQRLRHFTGKCLVKILQIFFSRKARESRNDYRLPAFFLLLAYLSK